jgi:formate-dependent nitrite reductase membrane component NrfD
MLAEPEVGVLQRIFPTWIFRDGECSWASPISILLFILVIAGFVIVIISLLKTRVKVKQINPEFSKIIV